MEYGTGHYLLSTALLGSLLRLKQELDSKMFPMDRAAGMSPLGNSPCLKVDELRSRSV